MLIALLILAALFLAYANGSNDNFKATATIYGSGTLGYRASLVLATGAQLAGSFSSVLLAGALLHAFGGRGLVPASVVQDPIFLVSVGIGAGATVLSATRAGLPISTTHALIGGLVGGGLVLAPSNLAWSELGARYFLPLLVTPAIAMLLSATLYPPLRSLRRRLGLEPTTCLCVGGSVEPVTVIEGGVIVLQSTRAVLTVAEREACTQMYRGSILGVSAQGVLDAAHGVSALSLGFARGLNDTPKILGLLVAAGWSGVDSRTALTVVAGAMALGGLLHSRRIAETLGHRITGMNRGQGLLANAVASGLVIGASMLGSPVSTTHVSTGAIVGIGVWSGSANWKVVGGIALSWVATLPLGALIAAGAATALGAL